MTVFSLLMLAVYATGVPLPSVSRSVRIEASSLCVVKFAPELFFLIASPNVSVMFRVLSVSVSPLAGANVGDGPVVSTVNVALAELPGLPSLS